MSGISFIGSYSGIDKNTIDQLIQAESIPLIRLQNQKENIVKEQNVWKDVNTRLNNLFDKVKVFQDPKFYDSRTGTSSSNDYVGITTTDKAIAGDYKVYVERLATSTSITGNKIDGVEDINKALGKSGSLNIGLSGEDGNSLSIEVTEEDSLKDIVNKINDLSKDFKDENGEKIKGTGVQATIIDNRIVLNSSKTGDRDISISGDLTDELGLSGEGVTTAKGTNAKFTINGIEVERDTNSVSDVVDGVTIKLKKEHKEGESANLKVDIDYGKIEKAVKDFVDQYNSTMNFLEENIKAGDPDVKNSAGALSGDSGLKRLHDELRKMATSVISRDPNGINDISELGVTTKDKGGDLSLDMDVLRKALKEDSKSVMDFFYKKEENGKVSGYAEMLNGKIDQFVSKKNGIIKHKNESYDTTLKDINNRIETFNERIKRKEEYYIKKFTALDTVMMQAEGQMSWLQSQISAMNPQ